MGNLKFSNEVRNKCLNKWLDEYGDIDIFGRKLTNDNLEFDHIWPISGNGSNTLNNCIPMTRESNREKADNTKGFVNNKRFWLTIYEIDEKKRKVGKISTYEIEW